MPDFTHHKQGGNTLCRNVRDSLPIEAEIQQRTDPQDRIIMLLRNADKYLAIGSADIKYCVHLDDRGSMFSETSVDKA